MRSGNYRNRSILWGSLTLLCMAVIFLNSALSGDLSNGISKGIVNKIQSINDKEDSINNKDNIDVSRVDKEEKGNFNFILRKFAHFFQFFMLAIFSIKFLLSLEIKATRAFLLGLIGVVLYACFDEAHQLFIDGRSGRVLDIFIDTAGGITGGIIIMLFNIKSIMSIKR